MRRRAPACTQFPFQIHTSIAGVHAGACQPVCGAGSSSARQQRARWPGHPVSAHHHPGHITKACPGHAPRPVYRQEILALCINEGEDSAGKPALAGENQPHLVPVTPTPPIWQELNRNIAWVTNANQDQRQSSAAVQGTLERNSAASISPVTITRESSIDRGLSSPARSGWPLLRPEPIRS